MTILKKFSKVIISWLLMFNSCFVYTWNCSANTDINNAEIKILCVDNINHSMALKQIESLVRANYNKNKIIQVGDAISIYNAESDNLYYVYPVYADWKCEYIAEVDTEGNTILTNNVNKIDILNNLSEGQYILFIDNGQLYAQNESNSLLLEQEYVSNKTEKSKFYYYSYEEKVLYYKEKFGASNIYFEKIFDKNCVLQINVSIQNIKTRNVVIEKNPLNMTYECKCNISDFVLQGNHPLCWAASCATIINYKTHSHITPTSLADQYNISYNQGASTYQIKRYLNDYGLSYEVYRSKLPWANIKANINADKPFVICLKASEGSEELLWHSITGYGYSSFIYDNSAGMRVIHAWDSNGSHISFFDSAPVINTAGHSFEWFGSVY